MSSSHSTAAVIGASIASCPTRTDVAKAATYIPGLVLAAALAAAAVLLADQPWVKQHLRVSALLIVILLGMLWRSTVHVPAATMPGIVLAQRPILRWAVAGLGFRLSVGELASIGG